MRTVTLSILWATIGFAQTPCEQLQSLKLPNTAITAAESVPAAKDRPAHCRVAAVLTPSSDSHIEMELWMPAEWNGKFEAVGNGGWSGSINRAGLAAALREGYAAASTDTGHKASETPGASFALGHPEKLIDFGYRSNPRDDGTVEGADRGVLRTCRAPLVLECLLQRRPAGVDGGAALSRRFRRDHGRRACCQLDRPRAAVAMGRAGAA